MGVVCSKVHFRGPQSSRAGWELLAPYRLLEKQSERPKEAAAASPATFKASRPDSSHSAARTLVGLGDGKAV